MSDTIKNLSRVVVVTRQGDNYEFSYSSSNPYYRPDQIHLLPNGGVEIVKGKTIIRYSEDCVCEFEYADEQSQAKLYEYENIIKELQDRIERLEEESGLKVVKYGYQNPTEEELLRLVQVGSTVYCSKEAALEILNAWGKTFIESLNPFKFTLYLNKNYLPKDAHITILADEKMKYEDYLFRIKE